MKVPKGSRVVMQVHYHRNGEEQIDQTRVGLHFAKEPVESELKNFPIYNFTFMLQPGKSNQKVTAQLKLPANGNIKLVGVTPHMHLLGKSMKIEATLPDGSKRCIVNVDQWDFKWQGSYTYKELMPIPGGTKFKLTAVYDNSLNNPFNPNNPPKPVHWGEQTTDEMCLAFVSYIVDRKATASAASAIEPAEEISSPQIVMGGIDLGQQSLMQTQSSLLSSSPTEMYNWSKGYSRTDLSILPWRKEGIKDLPTSACH